MKKTLFFGLAVIFLFEAGAAIFTPTATMDDSRQIANDLKSRGAGGSQAQLADYLHTGKTTVPAVRSPGIGEQVFGSLTAKP